MEEPTHRCVPLPRVQVAPVCLSGQRGPVLDAVDGADSHGAVGRVPHPPPRLNEYGWHHGVCVHVRHCGLRLQLHVQVDRRSKLGVEYHCDVVRIYAAVFRCVEHHQHSRVVYGVDPGAAVHYHHSPDAHLAVRGLSAHRSRGHSRKERQHDVRRAVPHKADSARDPAHPVLPQSVCAHAHRRIPPLQLHLCRTVLYLCDGVGPRALHPLRDSAHGVPGAACGDGVHLDCVDVLPAQQRRPSLVVALSLQCRIHERLCPFVRGILFPRAVKHDGPTPDGAVLRFHAAGVLRLLSDAGHGRLLQFVTFRSLHLQEPQAGLTNRKILLVFVVLDKVCSCDRSAVCGSSSESTSKQTWTGVMQLLSLVTPTRGCL
eukprot:m.1300400 g.1300400  ORF g.1300400 m.1300400 type:complete len:372 (+) comp24803_c0_seq2:1097-2212(+)